MKILLLVPAIITGAIIVLVVFAGPPVLFVGALVLNDWGLVLGSLFLWGFNWGVLYACMDGPCDTEIG